MLIRGVVTAFDVAAGRGVVTTAEGELLSFHATAVSDGSRQIDPGAAVTCRRTAAHRGQFEATDLRVI
jgi:cold shock CspA family protein